MDNEGHEFSADSFQFANVIDSSIDVSSLHQGQEAMLEVPGVMSPGGDPVDEQQHDDLLDEVSLGFSVPAEQSLLHHKIPEESPIMPEGISLVQDTVIDQLPLGVDPSSSLLISGDPSGALSEEHLDGIVQPDASSVLELPQQPIMEDVPMETDVAMETDEQHEVGMEVDSPPIALPAGTESSHQGFDEVDALIDARPTEDVTGIISQALIEEPQPEITADAEARTEDAEARTEDAEARTEDAEVRTEDAEARTEDAEVRTEDAEARTEDAEVRTEDAEARTEDAEARIVELDPKNVEEGYGEPAEETSGNGKVVESNSEADAVEPESGTEPLINAYEEAAPCPPVEPTAAHDDVSFVEIVPEEEESAGSSPILELEKTEVKDIVAIIDDKPEELPTPIAMTHNTANPSAEEEAGKTNKRQKCIVCSMVGKCKYNIVRNGDIKHLCDDACFKVFRANPSEFLSGNFARNLPGPNGVPCTLCQVMMLTKHFTLNDGGVELPFCSRSCKTTFITKQIVCPVCQKKFIDKKDHKCKTSLHGPYLNVCSQACSEKLVSQEAIAPKAKKRVSISKAVNDPQAELIKCFICEKSASIKHEVASETGMKKLCSEKCLALYTAANQLTISNCVVCSLSCGRPGSQAQTIQFEGSTKNFCSDGCLEKFKQLHAKTVACAWCAAVKRNFEMIERVDANSEHQLFCSLNCLSLYRVNLQATSNQSVCCDQCKKRSPAQYHLTMSDASVRNFCSYSCVMSFQTLFNPSDSTSAPTASKKPKKTAHTPTPPPSTKTPTSKKSRGSSVGTSTPISTQANVPVISSVMSLASTMSNVTPTLNKPQTRQFATPQSAPVKAKTKTMEQKVIVQPPPAKLQKNKALLCKPFVQTKATSCKPHMKSVEMQTDEWKPSQVLIPVPVPIYVPVPVRMYTTPVPFPLPIPIPLPVPCFIPTTKKSTNSIMKHVKEIQERIPTDPFEAEMLMMAERLVEQHAGSSSEEEDDAEATTEAAPPQLPAAPPHQANDLGEDMLQIAMRMASEMPDEALDVEDSVAPTPIQPDATNPQAFATIDENSDILSANRDINGVKGRKRTRGASKGQKSKRSKEEDKASTESTDSTTTAPLDANMVLKYTYGVNAWKHWVVQKNLQIEKTVPSQRPRFKPFKLDVMQCTADELNYSLCLFVKEVRKPNGEEYAPDSIFYLCLGIQQYLLENGRIDNIFSDTYYEGFTDHLNEILARYEVRLNSQGLIVCRIEEEHLWEAKQLGAHSPHVLLNTLIYFNTKYFMLKTPDEHLRLSFSHIMKHWKKTTATGTKTPGRAVYLRYYAPTGNPAADAKKKKEEIPLQEQGENTTNPLRCPVKLYEFYLSKCPESIKNRNDVFYLIPERSCVPDSPVWYSTGCLGLEAMTKMLNRLRVVREIQEAHLHYIPY